MSNFGELKLRSTPPPVDETDDMPEEAKYNISTDNINGFSTIDLNGTQNTMPPSQSFNEANYKSIDGSGDDLGYTSFDKAATHQLNNSKSNNNNNNKHFHSSDISDSHRRMQFDSPMNSSPNTNGNGLLNGSTSSSGGGFSSMSSPTSMMSTAGEVSTKLALRTASTIENLKQWSKSAYKCTRQIVSEKLGKCSRTVDPEIENAIEQIRDVRKKYDNILTLANSMAVHFRDVVNSQRLLGENFADLAQKSSELIDEFTLNCETQRQLVKHGESLLDGLNHFTSSLRTLCHKTIEDTLVTVRNFEAARLEYDAYKTDLEYLKTTGPSNEQKVLQIKNLEDEVSDYKDKYEKLKIDVSIKMKFLDENRVKVMKKQLLLFQNAIFTYFSGNLQSLESIMKQFHVDYSGNQKLDPNPDNQALKFKSFLENN